MLLIKYNFIFILIIFISFKHIIIKLFINMYELFINVNLIL